jgi:hypothetical protein
LLAIFISLRYIRILLPSFNGMLGLLIAAVLLKFCIKEKQYIWE